MSPTYFQTYCLGLLKDMEASWLFDSKSVFDLVSNVQSTIKKNYLMLPLRIKEPQNISTLLPFHKT